MDDTTPTHVTMQHAESGGVADFPIGAVDLWKPRGWAPVEQQTKDVPPKADPTPNRPAARTRATDSQE